MGVSISESSGACVIGVAMELLSTQQFQRQWEVIRDLAFVTVPPSKTVTAPGENGIYGCSDAPPQIVLVTLSSASRRQKRLITAVRASRVWAAHQPMQKYVSS